MSLRRMRWQLLFGAAIAGLLSPSGSWAQSTSNQASSRSDTASSDTIETVTVTARRVEENEQTVPIAITALTGDDLRNAHIKTAEDLQNFVPSLSVSDYVNHDPTVVIRGMGPTGGYGTVLAGGGTGVVSYFGDAVANISEQALFFDLTNVQVVKGPQGTLFGKNTTGGVVVFTPAKPSDEFGGYADASVGDYGLKSVDAAVNVPVVGDKLLVRVAGELVQRDGYTRDRGPIHSGKDYGNENYWNARLSVVLRPADGLENYTVLYAYRSFENGPGYVLSAVNPSGSFAFVQTPYLAEQQAAGPRSTALSTNEFDKRLDWGVVNTTKWTVSGNVTIKNIASYEVQKWMNAQDLDASPYIITDLVGPQNSPWHTQVGTYTDEVQIQGAALADNLKWTAGAYFEFGHNIAPQPYQVDVAFGNFTVIQPDSPTSERDHGFYGQFSYDFGGVDTSLKGLRLTAGYRYTWDAYRFGISLYSPDAGNACFTGPGTYSAATNYCLFSDSGSNSGPSWTLGLDYQFNDSTLFYVRSGQGYIPGGFNPAIAYAPGGASTPQYRFAPEKNVDVELGVKSQFKLAGLPTLIDADVFHTDFSNMQRIVYELVSYNGLGIPSNFTTNASQSVIEGIEFQGTIIPFSGFEVGMNYSYNFGKYTRIDPAAAPSLVGIPFADLPWHKLNLNASYTLPLDPGLGAIRLGATYSYQSKYFDAPAVQLLDYIPGYSLVNLRLSWDSILGSSLDGALFVTNATDTVYRAGQYGTYASDGYINSLYGAPRMFGVQLRYNFGQQE